MSSFRDKLNSKLSLANNKPTQQKVTNFDESWLKINVVGGQTQLCPIKLNCMWALPNINSKAPELSCKWFNKTQNSMNIIEGVNGSYYQPSLADVATIIHVQCVPYLEGVQYEGMPIIKQIGPIKIDPETQEQANELLSAKKAIFSIKIKSRDIVDTVNDEALIKIHAEQFRIVKKAGQQETQIINVEISEKSILLQCLKSKPKEVEITLDKDQKMVVELSNNKIRDVFLLLFKLISINREQNEEIMIQKSQQKSPKSGKQEPHILAVDQNGGKQKSPSISDGNNQSNKCEETENCTKESQKQKSNKKQQTASEEDLGYGNNGNQNLKQIKSTQELSFVTSSPNIKKGVSKPQQHIQSVGYVLPKQSALDTLQITDLKKQLRAHEGYIHQLNKTIGEKNEKIESLCQQINRMKERQANLSCNFFQLEVQVKKIREGSEKTSQEISYYKNQNRILKMENENALKKNKALGQEIDQLSKKLMLFSNQASQTEVQTYSQLKEKYMLKLNEIEQINAKYEHMRQEVERSQEKIAQIREKVDQVETQKNFYKKKYENLTEELQSNSQSSYSMSSSPAKMQTLKERFVSSMISSFQSSPIQDKKQESHNKFALEAYEKQILDLKKHLKESIEQNNFLRSVNAGGKDKKSSSKTILKMELAEMKKIVNRLTEAVTEKDLAIENTKRINKELNQKLLQAKRLLTECTPKISKEQASSFRHTMSFN